MPREVVALVSADDLVAAVRVHADRVHDLLRRSGCGPEESVEVSESYAFALIDAIVNAPETVGDMAGWWFGRALELGRRLGDTAAELPGEATTSVLSGTSGEAQVRAAVARLPEQERAAVMLRDAYDLPPQAVAVAIRRDLESAAELVATGRLRLVGFYDDLVFPDLTAHTGRAEADLGQLGALADGTLPAPRAVPLRRHLSSCPTCEEVVERLAKGRRLAAALPVIAMPDDAREAIIERVAARASSVLPSVDEVLLAIDEDESAPPAISPVAVIFAIVLALVLGVAVAAVTANRSSGSPVSLNLPTPTFTPSFALSSSPAQPSATPRHRKSATPSASTTASAASPTASTSTSLPLTAEIAISPSSGGRGTVITVNGSGWPAGTVVQVRYSGSLAGSGTQATADAAGRFTTDVTANGPLPGNYQVTATDGVDDASAPFRQTS